MGLNMLILCTKDIKNIAVIELSKKVNVMVHSTGVMPTNYPQGSTILLMGGEYLKELADLKVIPKNRTISSLRGSVFKHNGADWMVTFSPGVMSVNYEQWVNTCIDMNLAYRLSVTGSLEPVLGSYKWVDDLTDFIQQLDNIYEETGRRAKFSLDLETVGLNPYNPNAWIVTINLCCNTTDAIALHYTQDNQPSKEVIAQLKHLLTCDNYSCRGANFKYDETWIRVKWGIRCTNFRFDTQIVGSLLDENRSNSLKVHAHIYSLMGGYSDAFDKAYDKGQIHLVPKDELLKYSASDALATQIVSAKQEEEILKDTQLLKFYLKILHPAAIAFTDVELIGIGVDQGKLAALQNELETEIINAENKALMCMPGRLRVKWGKEAKLTKAKMLSEFMFSKAGLNLVPKMVTEKTGAPSTAIDHLLMFDDNERAKPFVDALKEYNSAAKTLSTYVVGFMKDLREDGRLHPSYFLSNQGDASGGTVSGRLSARNPAFQCQTGETLVLTSKGWKTLLSIVEGYEKRRGYKVLTHTGAWREVRGVYRNGVRPVFKVTLSNGLHVTCTKNHPLLTEIGFIKCEDLRVGYNVFTLCNSKGVCYASFNKLSRGDLRKVDCNLQGSWGGEGEVALSLCVRESNTGYNGESTLREHKNLRVRLGGEEGNSRGTVPQNREDDAGLSVLGEYEDSLPQPKMQSIPLLRREGYFNRPKLGGLQRVCEGHGRTFEGDDFREVERGRKLLQGKLLLDSEEQAKSEYQGNTLDNLPGGYIVPSGVGEEIWIRGGVKAEDQERVDYRGSNVDSKRAAEAGFTLATIVSIEYVGDEQTYDLTIDSCHSFVSNGVVVHNTVPKNTKWSKDLRKCFIPPKGMVLIANDYSQGELRIAACLANELNMIQAYNEDKDLHAMTGAALAGYSWDDFIALKDTDPKTFAKYRQGAKGANFGLLYGMSAEGYRQYAATAYNYHMTEQEAVDNRNAFFTRYPALQPWHTQYKKIARDTGCIRSPLGRVRHLPLIRSTDRFMASKAERQAVNSPVQSALSDMALWAIAILHKEYGFSEKTFWVCGAVHDQLLTYVQEDSIDIWIPRIKEVMENLPFETLGWQPQVKFTVDCEVGGSLGDLVPYVFK